MITSRMDNATRVTVYVAGPDAKPLLKVRWALKQRAVHVEALAPAFTPAQMVFVTFSVGALASTGIPAAAQADRLCAFLECADSPADFAAACGTLPNVEA